MHSQALALWKAGGVDLPERLRRSADQSRDFLSFWAALDNNFETSETDVLLAGIAKFRDKVNAVADNRGNLRIDRLHAIVSELEQTADQMFS